MPEDMWQMPDEMGEEPRARSMRVRVGKVVVVAAALATLGVGGVAAASSAGNHPAGSTTPVTHVQNVSTNPDSGAAGTDAGDCPFHKQESQTNNASARG